MTMRAYVLGIGFIACLVSCTSRGVVGQNEDASVSEGRDVAEGVDGGSTADSATATNDAAGIDGAQPADASMEPDAASDDASGPSDALDSGASDAAAIDASTSDGSSADASPSSDGSCTLASCHWQISTIDRGNMSSIAAAMTPSNTLHTAYLDSDTNEIIHTTWVGTGWSSDRIETGLDSPIGVGTSMAIGSDGVVRVAYAYRYVGMTSSIAYAQRGSTWQKTVITGEVNPITGGETSLAIDDALQPVVAYTHSTNIITTDLIIARMVSGMFENVPSQFGVFASTPDLALDRGHLIHVVYTDGQGYLHYAIQDASMWSDRTVASMGLSGTLALDSQGRAHIAYMVQSNTQGVGPLFYARPNGSAFDVHAIDSGTMEGASPRIRIGPDDVPQIAYYDASQQILKYARWNGSGFDVSIVDSTSGAGAAETMVLDTQGTPSIVYAVWNTELKLATLVH
jgi:hypothetical protein